MWIGVTSLVFRKRTSSSALTVDARKFLTMMKRMWRVLFGGEGGAGGFVKMNVWLKKQM